MCPLWSCFQQFLFRLRAEWGTVDGRSASNGIFGEERSQNRWVDIISAGLVLDLPGPDESTLRITGFNLLNE